jgi:hypothetical protein
LSSFRPGFIMVPYAVFSDPNLSHAAKLVYGRLKLYAGKRGHCCPKQETLAGEVCLSDRQLQRMLTQLRDEGWISWDRSRANCTYTVHVERPEMAGPDTTKMSHLEEYEIRQKRRVRYDKNDHSGQPLYRKEKKFEKMSPLTPEGQGSEIPDSGQLSLAPEVLSTEVNGNHNHAAKPDLSEVIHQIAERIHQRHPHSSDFPRRDCSAARVGKLLTSILKRISAAERQSYLERIDRNHAGMCESESWQKDGGQYVKGLGGWLAPTKELYLVEPPAPKQPVQSTGTVYTKWNPPTASNA